VRKKKSFKDKQKRHSAEQAKENKLAKERYARKKRRAEECKTRELLNDRLPPQPGPRVKKTPLAPNELSVSVDE